MASHLISEYIYYWHLISRHILNCLLDIYTLLSNRHLQLSVAKTFDISLPKSAPLPAFLISVNNTFIQWVAHIKKRLEILFFTQTIPKKVIYNLEYIQICLLLSISAITILISHLDHCKFLTGLSIISGYNPFSTYQPRCLFW